MLLLTGLVPGVVAGSVEAVTCFGLPATILGTEDADILPGTEDADVIVGLGGDDTITGLGGGDRICGGPGNDAIDGGLGNDRVLGGDGDDVIEGGGRRDVLRGEGGNDRIVGGSGNDRMFGGPGDDLLIGGPGADEMAGNAGRDTLRADEGDASLDGGVGRDQANFAGAGVAVSVDLTTGGGTARGARSGGFTVAGVEDLVGSAFDDQLVGDGGRNEIDGGGGTDLLDGYGGADRLSGSAGDDTLSGGPGNDVLFGGAGDDILNGDTGTDRVTGGLGIDTCYGEIKATCELPGSFDFGSGTVHLAVSTTDDAISVISVDGPGVITDLDVGVLITHTYVGDLRVTLTHVDTGTVVTIIHRPGVPATSFGCSGDNINATLDDEATLPVEDQCRTTSPTISGSVKPNNLLSAFDGENLGGTWRLTVTDWATLDHGFLEAWSLHFQAG
ncbi:MAG: proprotein convertase P-domain-containing protein [Actinomycetota bacterium]